MVFSVGTAFAADNATDVIAVDDEITVDEPLAVEQDVQKVSANESSSAVVTPENVDQYIDESGGLYENVTADKIIFDGTFNNLNLTVKRAITLTGGIFNNPNFQIYSSDVTLNNFTIVQDSGVNSIFVAGDEENHTSDVVIDNVNIVFTDDQMGAEVIPIQVMHSDDFMLMNSYIAYTGKTNGYYINNAIRLTNSKNAIIFNNKIHVNLVSAAVGWAEEPAGSGNWVSNPMSEAVVIKNSDGATLDGNLINVTYGDVVGAYDTIYTVDVSESNDVLITNNEIISYGNNYIYGIIVSGDDFTISGNNITSTGVDYANGIDIEGPATGVVENNNIDVNAETSAYAIYSGMNGQNVSANYTGNNITGKAYNIFGFSLGDVESNVKDNYIDLEGNYTTGLAARTGVLDVTGNRFVLISSEEGNKTISEGMGVAARGIFAMTGNVTIDGNVIATSGAGVFLTGVDAADVKNNFINVVANADKDAYGIYAGVLGGLTVADNNIDYEGATSGTGVNNGLFIAGTDGAIVANNNFTLDLVSSYVPWPEVPAGSGNWVKSPVSEGIVVKVSDNVVFDGNNVNVTYGDVVGSYDTIYVVDFVDSNNAVITNNDIVANGNSYIYGIILAGDDFIIRANNISSTGVYYANGIDIEGPATGVVEENVIDVNAVTSVYAIYSGMNGQNVSANYTGNVITGKAYNVFGFSLGDVVSNVEDNEITLDGNYTTGIAYRGSDLGVSGNHIVLTASEEGNETVWENFGVEAVGIKVINGTAVIEDNTISTPGKGVHVEGAETDVYLYENFINVVGNEDQNAYAIFAIDASSLFVNLNTIDYQGATTGTGVNNGVYANNVTLVTIIGNNFTLDLVSSYVPWFEIPAGSGNYVSFPISEGIVVEDSDVVFSLNKVDVTYGDVVGAYDTIYAVDVKADNALITDNEINAKGHTYIYGLIVTGENFTIESNNITVESDNYYANGIDIEGPASGVVEDNVLDVTGVQSAYAIYSGMNGQDVSANYTGNNITGNAYNVFGFSLGDVESNIADNEILLAGNYTTGIAYRGAKLTVNHNLISVLGTNVGDEYVWEAFGVETIGIKVVNGSSTITNNSILSTGDYPVDVQGTAASVHDNVLSGVRFIGDEGVRNDENSEVYNNTPEIDNKTATMITITEVDGSRNVTGTLVDADGSPISDVEVEYTINGVSGVVKTDANGTFKITDIDNGKLEISYGGDSYTEASNATITLKDIASTKLATQFNVTNGLVFTCYAVDYKAGERGKPFEVLLTDSNGKPLANVTVYFGINGYVHNKTTDENGVASLPINLQNANTYTCAVMFMDDETHNATFAVASLNVIKKTTSITASAKSYKASVKTKKYTVTLKTIKGSSVDGKTYLKSGLKVTLKVNGKTYTAKINAKGQATFKITNLSKKGKFAALIKFAGDKTYAASSKKVTLTIK
ncbi:carboxypeptidase regulatory-like domain-containing protein [Methanobrevibacter sp.]|uniref:carboxypeptidase regulatory-like domain-containing protein n=1 Tax=Methanobrevibacter sp. TaxID=66852 RepID=UPI002E7997FC|nr:carboxypeptidase regulatory-like domain-containing protein [Methanobrevibacter sp.]